MPLKFVLSLALTIFVAAKVVAADTKSDTPADGAKQPSTARSDDAGRIDAGGEQVLCLIHNTR